LVVGHRDILKEEVDKILFILENRCNNISPFEKALINNRLDAYKLYGGKTSITPKQADIIGEVHRKVKMTTMERL